MRTTKKIKRPTAKDLPAMSAIARATLGSSSAVVLARGAFHLFSKGRALYRKEIDKKEFAELAAKQLAVVGVALLVGRFLRRAA